MKDKKTNSRIGTVLTAVSCLIAAVLFWLFAKYLEGDASAIKLFVGAVTRLL